jgi:hypothetical protein
VTLAMPATQVHRATDDLAREIISRARRAGGVLLGLSIVLAGIAIAPIPGPGGLPVIVIGVMIVLRNSYKARRQFVRFQRAYPKMAFPIRRLLRREPEFMPVFWQQALRVERLLLPQRFRLLVRWRRRHRRRTGGRSWRSPEPATAER